jgi:Fur family transcriptional regulator, zinc uptake regulator
MVRASVGQPPPPFAIYEKAANQRGLALTDLRRAVLRLLWRSPRCLGAYEVARELGKRGSSAYAVSAYRTLAALVDARLAIHLVSRRRYAISPDPEIPAWTAILCSHCNHYVLEPAKEIGERLATLARAKGFVAAKQWLECLACCQFCSPDKARGT